ncbi:putative bifunctional diguanylate cyclase/phosphodiesterase [Sphingomonas oligophenolica]|uniref:GGDEF domain-containing protein n=1 Tax=Sphingomonas oligophenolica TaxID=301154 RepID=A0A502CQE4_9SPHN|nr:GGDEF domain-containing phosphodiesterase [Sphingomonas oligophenolica]TPG14339.1 GGDEF domain-containing protein [Sphingomonas oligophenolica]
MTDRRTTLAGRADDPTMAPVRTLIATRIEAEAPAAVILVALSRVDIVNAAYGRPTGDALIEAVGTVIARIAADTGATLAALGGVEFALGVPGDLAAAHEVAGCLTAALTEPFVVSGIRALVGHRIGLAVTIPGDDTTGLLRKAREALTAAKASDGTTMRIAAAEDVAPLDELAVDLHHAIERGEIDIVFQPQVEIATGRITGVEALARWDHGRLGAIGAETLFAAADRADLGVALSDHIQQLVLSRAAAWGKALGALRVALNLTAADVTRPGFAKLFLARIDASGFPRGRLTIEITETGLIRDLPAVATLLADLRGAGCRVAIDDFGTGYSSLAYLKSLPLDYLKIDKSLTTDIDGSARDRVVVRGVIDIARALGVAVIAEGVETEAQLRLLAADGCDYYQGFLLAGALGETALAALMEKQ